MVWYIGSNETFNNGIHILTIQSITYSYSTTDFFLNSLCRQVPQFGPVVPFFYCMLLRRKSIALRSFSPSLYEIRLQNLHRGEQSLHGHLRRGKSREDFCHSILFLLRRKVTVPYGSGSGTGSGTSILAHYGSK